MLGVTCCMATFRDGGSCMTAWSEPTSSCAAPAGSPACRVPEVGAVSALLGLGKRGASASSHNSKRARSACCSRYGLHHPQRNDSGWCLQQLL